MIDAATEKLVEFVSRPLGVVDLCAMFIDGVLDLLSVIVADDEVEHGKPDPSGSELP